MEMKNKLYLSQSTFFFLLELNFIFTLRNFYSHISFFLRSLSDQERLKALEVHLPTVDYYRKLQETDRELDRIEPLDVKRGNPLGRDR